MKLEVGTVYHCKTEEDANDLLARLHDLGYKWRGGDSLLEDNSWNQFKNETCYLINEDKKISMADIHTYVDMVYYVGSEIIKYKKQPIIDMHIKHQIAYENWQECEKQIKNLMRLIEALDITVEDSDIYDDREMLVVPKRTIHDEELIEIYRKALEENE